MDLNDLRISEKLVPANYLELGRAAQVAKATAAKELLEKRKLPACGWRDAEIEDLVRQLAALDSNNFPHKIGLGEREARIACGLVARRHYNFGHGIGRSGDLLESQPKAAGSTLLANLTNALLLDLVRQVGVRSCRSCFLVPMATGMTLSLCLLALQKQRPRAQYVLWSRIDQKSCFKCMTTAGLQPVVVELAGGADGLVTDCAQFEAEIRRLGAERILCILSTTSCFAPRNCDDIEGLARLAALHELPHVVNNAYGLQSTYLTHRLEQAQRVGRVDLFVQSTDKNLMVPVGAAIVAGFDATLVERVAKSYAGRATSSHTLDVCMTLLSLGRQGYAELVRSRKANFGYLRGKLTDFAAAHAEQVIASKGNPISLALTLRTLSQSTTKSLTQFGAMLYTRGVSGVRVIAPGDVKTIDDYTFQHWGSHASSAQVPYLTVAAALGVTEPEIDAFFRKLENSWQDFLKQ